MIIVKWCNTKVLFSSPDIDSIQVQDGYDVPVYLRLNWKICNKNKILLVIGRETYVFFMGYIQRKEL